MFRIVVAEGDAEVNLMLSENIDKRLKSLFEIPLRRRKFTPYDIARKHHELRLVFRERLTQKRIGLFGQPAFAAFQMDIGQMEKPELPVGVKPYLIGVINVPLVIRCRRNPDT